MFKALHVMLAMTFTGAAGAQIMECVDAKGTREYAQACPPGTVKETRMMKSGTRTDSGAAASPAGGGKSLAERDAEFKKRQLERKDADAKAEKDKAEAKDAERNCNDSRSALKALQDGLRVPRIDPNTGERSFLEDKDRPAEIANAQKAVDNWCKKK